LKTTYITVNGSLDTIDQTGPKLILNLLLLQIQTELLLKLLEKKLPKLLLQNIAVKPKEHLPMLRLWLNNTKIHSIRRLELLLSINKNKLKTMSTIDNGLQDTIDQTGLKSIQNHMLIQIPIDKFSIALLNLLLLLLLNNKLKKLLLTLLLQNHKLMLLLQLSIRKRTSSKLEWIKQEEKQRKVETLEVGDSYGQSTHLPKKVMLTTLDHMK